MEVKVEMVEPLYVGISNKVQNVFDGGIIYISQHMELSF